MRILLNRESLNSLDDDQSRIVAYREIWKKKEVLRRIYWDKWDQMMSFAKEGNVLEIGSGPGFFKEYRQDCVLMDVFVNPWIDVVGDGTKLPFADESFSNIVFVDVLHHVPNAIEMMTEVQRVLKKGGSLIIEEPYISPFSYLPYCIHHEELDLKASLEDGYLFHNKDKTPLEANLATPTLMFGRDLKKAEKLFPDLKLVHLEKQDCFFHVLFGNFAYKQMLPTFLYRPLKIFEKALGPLRSLFAFKILIVMTKTGDEKDT